MSRKITGKNHSYGKGWLPCTARKTEAGLGGFEPPASGLEARRYVQAKPQARVPCNFALVDN